MGDEETEHMIQPAEEAERKAKLWLGGEAVVPRYPRQRQFSVPLTGMVALATGISFAAGFWIGYHVFGRKR